MQLLTIRQAARALRVSEATVRQWAMNGELATVDLGTEERSKIRVRDEDLVAFVETRRVVRKAELPVSRRKTGEKLWF